MTESYAVVVLYDLNCDHPKHDRIAFAKSTTSDPDESEYRTDNCPAVNVARFEARQEGWKVRADGTCICPMCFKLYGWR